MHDMIERFSYTDFYIDYCDMLTFMKLWIGYKCDFEKYTQQNIPIMINKSNQSFVSMDIHHHNNTINNNFYIHTMLMLIILKQWWYISSPKSIVLLFDLHIF